MIAEIVSIGDEILIGQIVNTNAVYIAKALNEIGIEVGQITSISDKKSHIVSTLDEAKKRAQVVIMTGGLGPTKDDLTKHTLCAYFSDTLVKNEEILNHIEEMFKKYVPTPINDENRKQALLPSKARIFKNFVGTASGMWFAQDDTVFISMPGVPFEMKKMVSEQIIPALQEHFVRPYIVHKTLLTYGLGESVIAERIEAWENALPSDIKLAYLPNLGRVRLRLSGKGPLKNDIEKRIADQIETLLPQIQDIFVGYEESTGIEHQIQDRCLAKHITLAVVESCTGGSLASRIAAIPGASGYFKGGVVAYENKVKEQLLGVSPDLISAHGVVSEAVALAMAKGVQEKFNATYGIATTGNAGPTKGDANAPLGTVCIAIVTQDDTFVETFSFGNHRERVIQKSVNKVFELLYKKVVG